MLIHALFDNKQAINQALNFTLYNGYFNGTDLNPNLSFFDTAEELATGSTTNLSSLATTTNNRFQQNPNDIEAMYDDWFMTDYTYAPNATLTITTRVSNNMRLTTTGFDPQLALGGTSRPTISSTNFKYIHLRCKIVSFQAGTTVDELQLFYFNSTGQGIDGGRRVVYPYGNFTLGQWINIVFDMTNVANWTIANWNQYRLDPIRDGNCVIDFEYFVISNSPNPPDFNNKSLKISGYFRAKKTGTYRFYTRSDDASFLLINDAPVVFNGGQHGAQNRFGNINMVAGTYYKLDIYYGDSSSSHEFSAGYLEPNDDGTNSNSINIADFTKDATFSEVYFETALTPGGGSLSQTLEYINPGLYGRFNISVIAFYIDRTNFITGKDDLLYINSPQLFKSFSADNFLILHEEPVMNEFSKKDYKYFTEKFELECEFNGKINLSFFHLTNGAYIAFPVQRCLLVLQANRINYLKV